MKPAPPDPGAAAGVAAGVAAGEAAGEAAGVGVGVRRTVVVSITLARRAAVSESTVSCGA